MSHPEKVLCVRKCYITFAMGKLMHGVQPFEMENFVQKLQPHLEYRVRDEVELDEQYMQIIPIVIVPRATHNSENNDVKMELLAYKRAKNSGEARMRDRITTNFGGHTEEIDRVLVEGTEEIDLFATMENCVKREIQEELGIRTKSLENNEEDVSITTLANSCVVIDFSDSAGRTHIGFLYSLMLPVDVEGYSIIEGTTDLGYNKLDHLLETYYEEMDGWARLVVEVMHRTENGLNSTIKTQLPN